jgi:hypothetical protein
MAEQLQIAIGADVSGLQTGLSKAEDAVKKFDNSVKKSVAASGQAQQALVNLGRVASDAPFGFIAIANNIEPLVQSFQSLGRQSGGLGATLKALGTSLAGPTGVLLAFSLVSSAVTVLSQKYGSLGNAINAIFGNFTELDKAVSDAAKSYDEFNKKAQTSLQISEASEGSVQGQLATVNALVKIAGDQTAAYDRRNAALKELASINKDYFGNLRIENGLVVGLTDAVNGYTASVVASAKAKGFEQAISQLAPQLNEQLRLLEALRTERDRIAKLPAKIVGIAATRDLTQLNEANAAYEKQRQVVEELTTRDNELQAALNTLTGEIVRNKVAVIASQQATETKTANDKAAAAATDEYAKAEARLNAEFARRAKERESLRAKAGQISAVDIFANQQAAEPQIQKSISLLDKLKSKLDETFVKPQSLVRAEIISEQQIESARERLLQLQEFATQTANQFLNYLGPSIDAVFSAIESGQDPIKALGESIKRLVIDIAKAVVKAAVFAAIVTAISGGTVPFGQSFQAGLGFAGGGGGGFSLPQVGRSAAPSFQSGAGIVGGGLNLAGQVVFIQRGTDLVGVLNAGSARINRVG